MWFRFFPQKPFRRDLACRTAAAASSVAAAAFESPPERGDDAGEVPKRSAAAALADLPADFIAIDGDVVPVG